MTQPAQTADATSAPKPPQGPRAQFIEGFRREHETTEKVLRAFPAEQAQFRPHERSSTAQMLAFTFVVEQQMMLKALRGESLIGGGWPTQPATWEDHLSAFDAGYREVLAELERTSDATLAGTTQFYVAPKQTGPVPTMQFLWMLVCDQIHHRGQMSVYLRMVGGKVPSIYGPTADEPWN